MGPIPIWTNDKTAFFKSGTSPVFFNFCVGVIDISWHNNKEAVITLSAQLPEGRQLLEIKNGDTLEIVYREYGPAENPIYEPGEVIIRMKDCTIQGKSIEQVVPISPDEFGKALMLNMFLECELELNFES